MLNTINCPHCGQEVSFETEALGADFHCPHCHQPITVEMLAAWQPAAGQSASTGGPVVARPGASRRWLLLAGALAVAAALGLGAYLYFRNARFGFESLAVPTNQLTLGVLPRTGTKEIIHQDAQYQATLHTDFAVAGVYMCEVTFGQQKPAPEEVDRIVRESLEACVKLDSSREILAMAFHKEEPLGDKDYSGTLVWKPEEKTTTRLSGQ